MCCGSKRTQLKSSLAQGVVNRPQPLPQHATHQSHANIYGRTRRSGPAIMGVHPVKPLSSPQPQNTASAVEVPPIAQPAPSNGAHIFITYLESAPMRVQGLATGHTYEFTAAQPVQEIDARDASPLLSTRYFRSAV